MASAILLSPRRIDDEKRWRIGWMTWRAFFDWHRRGRNIGEMERHLSEAAAKAHAMVLSDEPFIESSVYELLWLTLKDHTIVPAHADAGKQRENLIAYFSLFLDQIETNPQARQTVKQGLDQLKRGLHVHPGAPWQYLLAAEKLYITTYLTQTSIANMHETTWSGISHGQDLRLHESYLLYAVLFRSYALHYDAFQRLVHRKEEVLVGGTSRSDASEETSPSGLAASSASLTKIKGSGGAEDSEDELAAAAARFTSYRSSSLPALPALPGPAPVVGEKKTSGEDTSPLVLPKKVPTSSLPEERVSTTAEGEGGVRIRRSSSSHVAEKILSKLPSKAQHAQRRTKKRGTGEKEEARSKTEAAVSSEKKKDPEPPFQPLASSSTTSFHTRKRSEGASPPAAQRASLSVNLERASKLSAGGLQVVDPLTEATCLVRECWQFLQADESAGAEANIGDFTQEKYHLTDTPIHFEANTELMAYRLRLPVQFRDSTLIKGCFERAVQTMPDLYEYGKTLLRAKYTSAGDLRLSSSVATSPALTDGQHDAHEIVASHRIAAMIHLRSVIETRRSRLEASLETRQMKADTNPSCLLLGQCSDYIANYYSTLIKEFNRLAPLPPPSSGALPPNHGLIVTTTTTQLGASTSPSSSSRVRTQSLAPIPTTRPAPLPSPSKDRHE